MKRVLRHLCFLAAVLAPASLGGAAWAACLAEGGVGGTGAPAVAGGVGGTGAPAVEGGVGGTGAPAVAGGVGGTGAPAVAGDGLPGGIGGTGIVGTISGFGSVCVAGLEVQVEPSTKVTMNGAAASAAELAIGQVVAIDATSTPKGLLSRSIAIVNALEGPITGTAGGALSVMGQNVRLTAQTRITAADGSPVSAGALAPGSDVRVSGYRDGRGEVIASRVQLATGLPEASAIGPVRPIASGQAQMDGLLIGGSNLPAQSQALVRGRWDGHALQAREVIPDPDLPFAGRAQTAVIEGRVQRTVQNARVLVNGFEVRLGASTSGETGRELQQGREARIAGRLEGGRGLSAERIEVDRGGPPRLQRDEATGRSARDLNRDERPERIERIERPERPERIERPERPETEQRGGRR